MDLDSLCDNQEKQMQPWSSTKGFKAEAEMELKLALRAAGASGLRPGARSAYPRGQPRAAPRGRSVELRADCGLHAVANAVQHRRLRDGTGRYQPQPRRVPT